MYYPKRFSDDGTTVSVDLHGCSVDGAMHIIRRTVQEAYWRGRGKVEIVHGASTSSDHGGTRTIKNELKRRLAEGAFSQWVNGPLWSSCGGQCTLWINIGGSSNPARIKVNDVVKSYGR